MSVTVYARASITAVPRNDLTMYYVNQRIEIKTNKNNKVRFASNRDPACI